MNVNSVSKDSVLEISIAAADEGIVATEYLLVIAEEKQPTLLQTLSSVSGRKEQQTQETE